MELISKQAIINKILSQPQELHSPSWYAIQIKALDSININEKIDQAYEDGYETGYLQAKFDYEQEKEESRESGEQTHSSRPCRMIPAAAWKPEYTRYGDDLWIKWECSNCGYIRSKGWEHNGGQKPKASFCECCGIEIG